jgi:hypothetical protein
VPLHPVPALVLPGVPAQEDVDRLLSSYEAWVYVDEGAEGSPGGEMRERTGMEVLA